MNNNIFCNSPPFNPNDIYPQRMSDQRIFTNYTTAKVNNCKLMEDITKKTGKKCTPSCLRKMITGPGKSLEEYQTECLTQKLKKMDSEMKSDLDKLECYPWNN